MAKELKGQAANLIVALVHLDFVADMELFQSVIVDILLSGQDHYYFFQDNSKSLWMDSGEDADKAGIVDIHMKPI